MTETKEMDNEGLVAWIRLLMADEIIEICPRCCENLRLTDRERLSNYLDKWGLKGGAAEKLLGELEKVEIKRGYFLFADCVDGEMNTSGTEFYLCEPCAEGGVSIYEKSEEWPIEGRFPESLTRS